VTCPNDVQLEDYARGRLSGAVEKDIREHVEVCQSCQSRIQSVKTDESMLLKAMSALMDEEAGRCTTIASLKKGAKNEHFISSAHGSRIRLDIAKDKVLGDRYQIVRELGQSGKPVYQAHDLELRCDVALKIVVVDPDRAEITVRQLRQELQLRTRISDFKNIIKAFDIHPLEFEGFSLVVLAMEYADGGSLRPWLSEHHNDGDKRIEEGISLLIQACQGCRAAHDHGVVHLDIKPENILLCRVDDQLIAKLYDFGISRILTQVPATFSEELLLVAGTPPYMSPEQFGPSGSKIGYSSDIYSLGVVLFEILAGKPPFDGTLSELRDQHMKAPPPTLSGDASRWSHVVERCLAKRPENRYSDVGQLAGDLVRGQRGYCLSVDIACSACGNVNPDPLQTSCSRCKGNLPETLFRPCPRCLGSVRLDQDDCGRCGMSGVAEHYLLEERKAAVERLKDEAPAEAIELIELMLREGAGDFESHATGLVKDLRAKQQKIRPLVADARKAVSAGQIEKAIDIWQGVLEVIPRHSLTLKSIDDLKAIVRQFCDNKRKVPRLMDKGQFDEAEGLLLKCLELMPAHEEVKQSLADCRRRAGTFSKAFEHAQASEEAKLLRDAEELVRTALSHAPKCRAVVELQKRISSAIAENKELVQQSLALLPQARFDEVESIVAMIERRELDGEGLPDLKKKLLAAHSGYTRSIGAVKRALDIRDLDEAKKNLHEALVLCPESSSAKSLTEQIEADQQNARELIRRAEEAVQAAKFQDADLLLRQAGQLWATMTDMEGIGEMLAETREVYGRHMIHARQAKEETDLTAALEAGDCALGVCPESQEAILFLQEVKSDQGKVSSLTERARQMISNAIFDKAESLLGKANELWANYANLGHVKNSLATKKKQYQGYMAGAYQAYQEGALATALKMAKLAVRTCPGSPEARSFASKVESHMRKESELREDRLVRVKIRVSLGVMVVLTAVLWKPLAPFGYAPRICTMLLCLQYASHVRCRSYVAIYFLGLLLSVVITAFCAAIVALAAHFIFSTSWSTGFAIGLWPGVVVCLAGIFWSSDNNLWSS